MYIKIVVNCFLPSSHTKQPRISVLILCSCSQVSADGSRSRIQSDTMTVGQNISTKAVGSNMRNDITNSYKHREGQDCVLICVFAKNTNFCSQFNSLCACFTLFVAKQQKSPLSCKICLSTIYLIESTLLNWEHKLVIF